MKNKHHVLSALVAVALLAALAGCQSGYNKPGFATEVDEDGRLWVFKQGGDKEKSEKHITLVGAGPDRMTVKAVDKGTALEYLATKPGFVAEAVEEDGTYRLWIFKKGGDMEKSEKHITRVGAGPMRTTLKAIDRETLDAYLAS